MTQLISSVLLIVSVLKFSSADPVTSTVWDECGKTGEYRNGSAFQRNLNVVLESLVGNVYFSGFNTSFVVDEGQNSNSTVYGLVQCRGDLDSSQCAQCASTAKEKLIQRCHNTSGFIQLDGCFLRYSNHYFYNDYIESSQKKSIVVICSSRNNSQPEQFTNAVKALLSNITTKAEQDPQLFAADSVAAPSSSMGYIYSIAQCWRDLSPKICGSCLNSASENIFGCQTGALGAQFGSKNCYLRYEVYGFFVTSILSPPVSAEHLLVSGKRYEVLGITLAVVASTLGLFTAITLWKWIFFYRVKCARKRIPRTKGDNGEFILSPTIANQELIFRYDILREATSNFNAENKLGEGGFGSVFKGVLPDGREVAVKRLYMGSRQGDAEFLNEANLISQVQHRNLVKLLGCCVESSERLLVYEYLENNSLDKIIFDTTKRHLLDWNDRYAILVGTARGLAYLHEESDIRIIHRDIKASNILLDDKHRPRIADFGLARFFATDQSHVSTRVAGTLGYMAPEYALRGQLTEKTDVFGFGVLVLEIISGRKNQSLAHEMDFLIEGTWRLYKAKRALEVMDPTLEGSYTWEEGIRVIKIGLLCTQAGAALRPSMSRVVSMLTSKRENLPSPTKPAFIDLDSVGTPDQIKRIWPWEAATSDNHSAAADPSSGILEPR